RPQTAASARPISEPGGGAAVNSRWRLRLACSDAEGHAGDRLERPAAPLRTVGPAGDRVGIPGAVDLVEVDRRIEPGIGDSIAGPVAVPVGTGQHLTARLTANASCRFDIVPGRSAAVVAGHGRLKLRSQIGKIAIDGSVGFFPDVCDRLS